jgi:hypothetical protein
MFSTLYYIVFVASYIGLTPEMGICSYETIFCFGENEEWLSLGQLEDM